MWSQTFRQRVCVSRLYLFFLLRPRSRTYAPLLPFPLYLLFSPNFDFSTPRFRSFFPFTVVIRLSKGSNAFYPTVQLLTGTLQVMNAIARLNIRTKREQGPPGLSPFAPARSSSSPPLLSFIPFWTRNDGDHGDRRSRETTAGCLKADIFLLHIINDRLARNVQ